jgi:hypothetical protein
VGICGSRGFPGAFSVIEGQGESGGFCLGLLKDHQNIRCPTIGLWSYAENNPIHEPEFADG